VKIAETSLEPALRSRAVSTSVARRFNG